jgi:4-carboxymuconolactone decarboxylase
MEMGGASEMRAAAAGTAHAPSEPVDRCQRRTLRPVARSHHALETGEEDLVQDVHPIFTTFKAEHPGIYEKYEALGHEVHVNGGPLQDQSRALIKVAIAAAAGHHRALETHIHAARQAGCSEEEIVHTLLLLVSSCGFPAFMEAYSVYKTLA